MRNRELINIAGIAALLYLAMQFLGKQIASRFSVGRPSFRVKSLKPAFFEGLLTLPIINNTSVSIPIDGFKGRLLYGQYKLADIAVNQHFTVVGNGQASMPINIYVGYGDLSGSLIDIISSGDFLNALRIEGHVLSKGLIVPVNSTIQLV